MFHVNNFTSKGEKIGLNISFKGREIDTLQIQYNGRNKGGEIQQTEGRKKPRHDARLSVFSSLRLTLLIPALHHL